MAFWACLSGIYAKDLASNRPKKPKNNNKSPSRPSLSLPVKPRPPAMRGRKRPHSGSNRGTRISVVSTVGGGASIIRKNKRVIPNATLTSAAASNDNDEVSCGFGLVRGFVHTEYLSQFHKT